MSAQTQYRVRYLANPGPGKQSVILSEINEAEDLETAYFNALDWAKREGWLLTSVEEVE